MSACDRVFYYPDRIQRTTPAEDRLAFEDVYFTAADGVRLHGWFIPAAGTRPRGTVLHLHGNAGNITGHYEFIRWLPPAGYNVFMFDYRGYGQSGGRVTRGGTQRDAEGALEYLRGRRDVDPGRIVLFGQSIGGAIGAVLAAQRSGQFRGVILDSTFTNYREIARYHVNHQPILFMLGWWFPWTIPPGLDAIDAVPRIAPAPLLIMHGRNDRIAPCRMAEQLFAAAQAPKELWLIDGADHMEVWWTRPQEAHARVEAFLQDLDQVQHR